MSKPKRKPKPQELGLGREGQELLKKISDSKDHDRHTCNCEGCKLYWTTSAVFQNGRFFEIVPTPKLLDIDEFHRSFQALLRYKMDKKTSKKKLIKVLRYLGVPDKHLEKVAERMLHPIFVVYHTNRRMMMRDI